MTALQVEPGRTRLFSIQEQVSEIQLSGACDLAGGTFSSLGSKFQCLAMNGDILTCDGTSHVCVGQVHAAARPPTLFGFATMPFGGGATVGGSTKSLASEEGGNNNNAAPPPVLY